jgi:hypothetical protein
MENMLAPEFFVKELVRLLEVWNLHIRGSSKRIAARRFNPVVLRKNQARAFCPPPSGFAKSLKNGDW